jgi:rhodanese-related sulfurtransferase
MVRDWTRNEVSEGLARGTILLVDVREPHEFAMGRIPGSTSMPLSGFTPEALPRMDGRTIVFSCAAGIRSLRAIEAAQAAGLAVDSHYGGGFKDWLMSGEAIEQG